MHSMKKAIQKYSQILEFSVMNGQPAMITVGRNVTYVDSLNRIEIRILIL